MKTEKEIEFKTEISKFEYNKLIKKFNLENKISLLTNYYFDSLNNSFFKNNKTLRIRAEHNKFVLTLKSKIKSGTLEKHIKLNESDASKMILNGFNLKDFFNIDIDVFPRGELLTQRASLPYNDGVLFFDKFVYYEIVKYEIEFEAKEYLFGLNTFKKFLSIEEITFIPTIKKSRRVYEYLQKNTPF